MPIFPACVLVTTATLLLAGCARKEASPQVPSVVALEADPILLSRVLDGCNERPAAAMAPECVNARAAAERRSATDEVAREKRAEAGFEMARDARRRADEAAQKSREALQKRMSPYELPVEGANGAAPAPAAP